jgi:hypothetical protein
MKTLAIPSPRGPARYGFADFDEPSITNSARGRVAASFDEGRQRVMDHSLSNARARASTACAPSHRAGLSDAVRESRTRLGFSPNDRGAPTRDPASTAQQRELGHEKEKERARLGMLEERDPTSLALQRHVSDAKGVERSRLGMFMERTTLDAAEVGRVRRDLADNRARLGGVCRSAVPPPPHSSLTRLCSHLPARSRRLCVCVWTAAW